MATRLSLIVILLTTMVVAGPSRVPQRQKEPVTTLPSHLPSLKAVVPIIDSINKLKKQSMMLQDSMDIKLSTLRVEQMKLEELNAESTYHKVMVAAEK